MEAIVEKAGIGAVAADLQEPVSILEESIQSDLRQCSSHHGLAGHGLAGTGVPFVVCPLYTSDAADDQSCVHSGAWATFNKT